MNKKVEIDCCSYPQLAFREYCSKSYGTLRDLASVKPPKKYYEMSERLNAHGFDVVLSEKDYPFSEEYVQSFLASSDYRLDVASAISSAPKRVNLGDITMIQDALQMDSDALAQASSTVAHGVSVLRSRAVSMSGQSGNSEQNVNVEVK